MKTKSWHRSLGALFFVPIMILAYYYLDSWLWWVGTLLVYLIIALTVTVGYHRLFSHRAFICNRFWYWFFGLVGASSLNSSPVEWSIVHINHHRYSDSDCDPYEASFRHFFRFRERVGMQATKDQLRMLQDPMHRFFFNHSLSIILVLVVVLLLVDFRVFLFLWAVPVSLYLVTSGLHTIFAHSGKSPKNLAILELFCPMLGEWTHLNHHSNSKDPYFDRGLFDLGGLFIRLIKI